MHYTRGAINAGILRSYLFTHSRRPHLSPPRAKSIWRSFALAFAGYSIRVVRRSSGGNDVKRRVVLEARNKRETEIRGDSGRET